LGRRRVTKEVTVASVRGRYEGVRRTNQRTGEKRKELLVMNSQTGPGNWSMVKNKGNTPKNLPFSRGCLPKEKRCGFTRKWSRSDLGERNKRGQVEEKEGSRRKTLLSFSDIVVRRKRSKLGGKEARNQIQTERE